MGRMNGFVGRRNVLKLAGIGSAGLAVSAAGGFLWGAQEAVTPQLAEAQTKPQPVSPDAALQRILEGNKRFVAEKRQNLSTRSRLLETAVAQFPFASILSCADSRVPSEIIMDQGLGDLFVVRLAGNVASESCIGSLEFATAVLGTQLLMVVGHERCGAVAAAVKGDPLPGRIGIFVEEIKPAVRSVQGKPGDPVENAVVANVKYQVNTLKEGSSILSSLLAEGKLNIVGARYDLDTGELTVVA
ncbi:carbonic anhydrase [Phormidium sp. LEGE 05292]|uniref:carbonic anhydrase n=1 Tax=[Phormidium] sp. LEGE 05292 TaxID=767427 RepID=UPI0018827F63|nr:carbonic anhydrase [Phormidium sp. LEGE 05292]MBE9227234.1 carbonic anhydrase [Phormidium sp. LEGE 05292]